MILKPGATFSRFPTLLCKMDNIILSIAPLNPLRLDAGGFSVELVNDSSRRLSFAISLPSGSRGKYLLRSHGSVEAATCLTIETLGAGEISLWSDFIFQALLYDPEGEGSLPDAVNVRCRVDPAMFRRESSYRRPLYSEEMALELPLVQDGVGVSYAGPDPKAIKEAMGGAPADALSELMAKYNSDSGKRRKLHPTGSDNPNKVLPTIEVDLHIHELVDSITGLDNTAMMELQLDTVRRTMRNHLRRHGQRIVFIHGKGDGVLRAAVRKLLAREFPRCEVQDASFQRYGFGATLVIIHRQ